jgi:glutathione S-transferase
MKIYDTQTAPTPRIVRIFLAEKGIDVTYEQVDIVAGDNLATDLRAKNPFGKVPILELDDGICISESLAICTYFEAEHPDVPLMGTTAVKKAIIMQWQQRMMFYLFVPVGMCFQHTSGAFKDRMTPVLEYGKEAGINAAKTMVLLDQHLAESTFVAGEQFSIADIVALCAIDFARVIKLRISPAQVHLQRWYDAVKTRPSYTA